MMKPLTVPSTPAEIALLLHEAVIYGTVRDPARFGASGPMPLSAIVVGRRRPFIPCGVDPPDVNRECERRYAVWRVGIEAWSVVEIDPSACVPFVDRAAQLAAADERANAVQRTNVKPTSAADGSQTKET